MKNITEENVKKTYGSYAPVYDLLFGQILEPGRKRLCNSVCEIQPRKLLEVGVGTGLTLSKYPVETEVVGVDLSLDMLRHALDRAEELADRKIELLAMDAENLQFGDGVFDCVVVPYVLSVTPHPQKLISELRRVCKSGGDIFILNHFSGARAWWLLEKIVSPVSAKIGFRSNFSFAEQIAIYDWDVLSVEAVNLLGLSKLVHIRNV